MENINIRDCLCEYCINGCHCNINTYCSECDDCICRFKNQQNKNKYISKNKYFDGIVQHIQYLNEKQNLNNNINDKDENDDFNLPL